ncbi:MAG: hypothetical protein JRH20_04270 [Deltaproteobacteria bacterium]|nr:hypothetical protein [Deltaproteobacteria bacterium]
MASALVYIELHQGAPTSASLVCLSLGREVATHYGASLYAVALCGQAPEIGVMEDKGLVSLLSDHGADRVVLVTNEALAMPALHATHGPALLTACEQFPPQLVILPNSAAGRDMGPRLAMELGGFFVGSTRLVSDVETKTNVTEFFLRRTLFGRGLHQRLALSGAQRPLVLCLDTHGRAPLALGDDEAEVVVLQAPTPSPSPLELDHSRPTPQPPGPRLIIGASAALEAEDHPGLEQLADLLGGEFMPHADAAAQGPLPEGTIYLACGASAEKHMATLAPDTRVLAVNHDEQCPIFRLAEAGLLAEAGSVLRDLLKVLTLGDGQDQPDQKN